MKDTQEQSENIKFIVKEVLNSCNIYFRRSEKKILECNDVLFQEIIKLLPEVKESKKGYDEFSNGLFGKIFDSIIENYGYAKFIVNLICKRLHMIGLLPHEEFINPPLCVEELKKLNKDYKRFTKEKSKAIPEVIKKINNEPIYKEVIRVLEEVAKNNETNPYLWELKEWNNL